MATSTCIHLPLTSGPNTESEQAYINENQALGTLLTRQVITLNGGTIGDGLVRVDDFQGPFVTKKLLEELLNLGNMG